MATKTKEKAKAKKEERGRSGVVVTPVVRASFPYVEKPDTGNEYSTGKYKITGLIEKDKEPELKPLKQACMAAAKQIWPKIKFKELEHPFRDGDETETEAHHGHVFFSAKSNRKPGIVGPDKLPLTEGDEVYGGCYVRFSVTAFTYTRPAEVYIEKDGVTKKKKVQIKGVSFALNNVQFIRDGERFGGGTTADDDFDEVNPADFEDITEEENFDEAEDKAEEVEEEETEEEEDDEEIM